MTDKQTKNDWYIYTGESDDAIAVAEGMTGPNGGWVGVTIAKMPLPGKYKTREQINANATLIAAAPELLNACNALIGLVELVAASSDISDGIKFAMLDSHRLEDARAALTKAQLAGSGGGE